MSEIFHDQAAGSQAIVKEFYDWIRDYWVTISRSPRGESMHMLNFGYWLNEDDSLFQAQAHMRDHIFGHLSGLPAGAEGLEVGCGIGGMTAFVAGRGYRVTCLDIVHEQLQRARALVRERGLSDAVRFSMGNSMAIPLRDACFDFIYCLESAFHYHDKPAFLRESRRVLKRGGEAVIADITCEDNSRVTFGRGNFFADSTTWRRMIDAAGFELIRHEKIGPRVYQPLHRYLCGVTKRKEFRSRVGRFWSRVLTNYADLAMQGIMDYEIFRVRKP